jgi:lipopolysaccharide transport system ATP-binding protein
MTFDTDLVHNRRELQKDHKGKVIASLQRLDLQPGRYNIDVGARSGDNFALDYLPSCAQVEILPGPTTPGLIIRENGGVRIPIDWKWMNSDENF